MGNFRGTSGLLLTVKFHSERTSREVAEKLPGKFGELPGKSGDFPEARGSLTPSKRLAKFVSKRRDSSGTSGGNALLGLSSAMRTTGTSSVRRSANHACDQNKCASDAARSYAHLPHQIQHVSHNLPSRPKGMTGPTCVFGQYFTSYQA